MSKDVKLVCHSGGCPGSDMEWETQGEKYGVKTIAYSFKGHNQKGKYPIILTGAELDEGWERVLHANKTLKRYPQGQSTYVKSLLSRNWFQVKNSEAVFAIGMFDGGFSKVKGGTGWAVQMAIDSQKPVFLFDQDVGIWTVFEYLEKIFMPCLSKVKLTDNFAGIGTREITDCGKSAIRTVYEEIFKIS